MELTGKKVIIGVILLGMVVAGLSQFVIDGGTYYNQTSNSTYAAIYASTTEYVTNMSSLTKNIQTKVQGEGGVVGTIIEGIVAIPSIIWSIFNLIIVTPIMLVTTLLASVIGIIGVGEAGALWISVGLEAIIIISIVWVFVRARFRYNV